LEETGTELTEHEKADLVAWDSLRHAAQFFGWVLCDPDGIHASAAAADSFVARHQSETGSLAQTSVAVNFFIETSKRATDPEAMRLFRMVCAVRSLVGKKRFTGTTKDMLRSRTVGGKSPSVASDLAETDPAIQAELDALQSRYRFDRTCREGAVRGFYTKLGAGRRIYLSLTASDPESLGKMVGKKPSLHAAYAKRERAARAYSKVASCLAPCLHRPLQL
jgi:hypothetical protein